MYLEVICGPMFAGKTTALIRRIEQFNPEGVQLVCVKPKRDTRRGQNLFTTHDGNKWPCIPIERPSDILPLLTEHTEVLAIDECQFFDDSIVDVITNIKRKIRIICAGLDMDFRGVPFPAMGTLLCVADKVRKHKAFCARCTLPAGMSQRLTDDKSIVMLGADDSYEARCRDCHTYGE